MSKKYFSNLNITSFSLTILLSLLLSSSTLAQNVGGTVDPAVIAAGEKIYKSNCTACHTIDTRLIGPALKGLEDRQSREWMISWIKNSQELVSSGDEYAVALFDEYNKIAMPAYPFSDDEIISILEYIKAESEGTVPQQSASADTGDMPDPASVAAGEKIYKANCTACHAMDDVVIGPALKGLEDRNDRKWLTAWIKNSQKLIGTGDDYAVSIFEEYNKIAMPSYPFTDEEIESILDYIKVESNKAPEQVATAAAEGTSAEGAADSGYLSAVIYVLVFVLILILVVLGLIVKLLTKNINNKSDLTEDDKTMLSDQKVNVFAFLKSNTIIGLVIFVVTAFGLKFGIDALFTIGVQQGYQPTQPIAYSHALHAGQYEIDCNYCHTGVRKSKNANIPSANICMNCHTSILPESPEIGKIYAAIDYDPKTGSYGDNPKPIEWVRIHNLPDLAYFNHSQHVEVGEVECQTCHGPIQEMEVVYQYSNLTMGWCINCHRETDVNTKGNDYYNNLVKLHKEQSKEPLKVKDIGGLECSKCHY